MAAPFQGYVPPGPVGGAFLACDDFFSAIMGPVGSGKTGASLMKMIDRGNGQLPDPEGWRRTKFVVIRDTFRELEKTTIPSWHHWVPKTMGKWSGGEGGRPATHVLRFNNPRDGSKIEIIVEFIGLGAMSAANAMPGWEGTGAYLNEIDKQNKDNLDYVLSRLGRYPAVDAARGFAGATWRGAWADFNAPDTEHWLYEHLVENVPEGFRLFVQPGGMIESAGRYILNPRAENLRNLVEGYYHQQIAGRPKWFIRRMVLNKWGASREGQPVYEEWDDDRNVSPSDLEPVRGIPLILGADAGLTPGVVIMQQMPNGQWRVYAELVAPPTGMGAQKFGALLNQLLSERFAWWAPKPPQLGHNGGPQWRDDEDDGRRIIGWGDPAANARASTDERSWMEVISAVTGIRFRPAPTNNLTPRLEAVRLPLSKKIDGQEALLIDRRCKILRKGFNSGYRLKKLQIQGSDRYEDQPEKNQYSHVHDGLQYGLLGGGGHLAVLGRKAADAGLMRQTRAQTEDDPEGEWRGGAPRGRQQYSE